MKKQRKRKANAITCILISEAKEDLTPTKHRAECGRSRYTGVATRLPEARGDRGPPGSLLGARSPEAPELELLAPRTVRGYSPDLFFALFFNHQVYGNSLQLSQELSSRHNLHKSEVHSTMNCRTHTARVTLPTKTDVPSTPGLGHYPPPSPGASPLPASTRKGWSSPLSNFTYKGSYGTDSCVRCPLHNLVSVQCMHADGFFFLPFPTIGL